MGRRWIARTALTLLACGLISVDASAASQTWSLVESGAIRVLTDDSPTVAIELVEELGVAQSMLKQIASVESQLPLRVFAVKDRKTLTELAPRRFKRGDIHTLGFSHTGAHAAFIVLRTDGPTALRAGTLRHEYAHVLTAAMSPEAPAWLDEGLAEFWSSVVVDGDRLVAGRPVAKHLELLRKRKWLPLDSVLNQRRGSLPSKPDQVTLFYAQAWAMVHYLLLGPDANGLTTFMPSTSTLPRQFESTIHQYVNTGRFREAVVSWQPPPRSRDSASMIPEARALAERADMLVSGEQPRRGFDVARQALAINPNEPLALEVIGTYHFLNNQPNQARDWLTRALATGTNSYAAALYMSLLSTSPADRERYLTLAVLRKPGSSVAWQRLAAIFEEDGRLEIARRWCREMSGQPLSWLFLRHATPCGLQDRQ